MESSIKGLTCDYFREGFDNGNSRVFLLSIPKRALLAQAFRGSDRSGSKKSGYVESGSVIVRMGCALSIKLIIYLPVLRLQWLACPAFAVP